VQEDHVTAGCRPEHLIDERASVVLDTLDAMDSAFQGLGRSVSRAYRTNARAEPHQASSAIYF
jgi:hypothetical protein